MKKRFSVEQIVGVLKQAEVGVPVVELIRKGRVVLTDLSEKDSKRVCQSDRGQP